MKKLLLLFALLPAGSLAAQVNVGDTSVQNFITNVLGVNGEPALNPKYFRIVEGSIFAPESFTKARIYVRNNKREIHAEARLNIVDDALHYLNENGKEIIATVAVEEVQFFDPSGKTMIFTWGIASCPDAKGWIEVLEKGKVNLFRKHIKQINESKTYGSATADQKVATAYSYWYQYGNTCKAVKKIDDLKAQLKDLKPELEQQLTRKLSDRKEGDWIDLVRTFNSL